MPARLLFTSSRMDVCVCARLRLECQASLCIAWCARLNAFVIHMVGEAIQIHPNLMPSNLHHKVKPVTANTKPKGGG